MSLVSYTRVLPFWFHIPSSEEPERGQNIIGGNFPVHHWSCEVHYNCQRNFAKVFHNLGGPLLTNDPVPIWEIRRSLIAPCLGLGAHEAKAAYTEFSLQRCQKCQKGDIFEEFTHPLSFRLKILLSSLSVLPWNDLSNCANAKCTFLVDAWW